MFVDVRDVGRVGSSSSAKTAGTPKCRFVLLRERDNHKKMYEGMTPRHRILFIAFPDDFGLNGFALFFTRTQVHVYRQSVLWSEFILRSRPPASRRKDFPPCLRSRRNTLCRESPSSA